MKIFLGPPSTGLCVGRLAESSGAASLEFPDRLCSLSESSSLPSGRQGAFLAIDASKRKRVGQLSDVAPGQHFLLVPRPGGTFEMRPVSSWFAFGNAEKIESANTVDPEEQMRKAELDLKSSSKQRRQDESRWQKIAEEFHMRRKGQVGEAEVESDNQSWASTSKSQPTVDVAKTWPALPKKLVDGTSATQVLHPEDLDDEDDFGVQTAKRRKGEQLSCRPQKEDKEDVAEVPETAAAVLSLKTEDGHAGWDFSDEEVHSDDEKGSDYNEDIFVGQDQAADEAEEAPSADEEDAPEKGALLNDLGQQIDALLQQGKEEGEEGTATQAAAMELQAILAKDGSPACDSDDSASGDDAEQEQGKSDGSGAAAVTVAAPHRKRPRIDHGVEVALQGSETTAYEVTSQSSSSASAMASQPPAPVERAATKAKGRGKAKAQSKTPAPVPDAPTRLGSMPNISQNVSKTPAPVPDTSTRLGSMPNAQVLDTPTRLGSMPNASQNASQPAVKATATITGAATSSTEGASASISSISGSTGASFRERALQYLRKVGQANVKELSEALGIKTMVGGKVDRQSNDYAAIVTVLKDLTDHVKIAGQKSVVFKLKPEFQQ